MYTIENVLKVLIFPLFSSLVILAFLLGESHHSTRSLYSLTILLLFYYVLTLLLLILSTIICFFFFLVYTYIHIYIYLFASLSYILCIRRILEMLAGDVSFFTDNRIVPCYFFLKFFSSFQRY